MLQRKPNMIFAVGSLREHLMLIDNYFKLGLDFSRIKDLVTNLFFLLSGECDSSKRYFGVVGITRFNFGFSHYNREFAYANTRESLEDFSDRFYAFLDECFPRQLDEEVYA